MKLRILFAALAVSGIASAEIVNVDRGVAVRPAVEAPIRGMTMDSVAAKYGQPASRHDAVGRPPITRWDYPGFSVFFEHQYVIHTVATNS